MKLSKGAAFRVASDYVVPLRSECQQCGRSFSFALDELIANSLWVEPGGLACYRCNPSVWLDAMIVRMAELKGMPFMMDKISV